MRDDLIIQQLQILNDNTRALNRALVVFTDLLKASNELKRTELLLKEKELKLKEKDLDTTSK